MKSRNAVSTAILVLLSLSLLLTSAAHSASAAEGAKYKVVMQVSDASPKTWNLALNNAHNLQSALGKDAVDIEIVAYGPGIGMFKKDSPVGQRVDAAAASGVRTAACMNTMHALKLTKDDMLKSVGYVPSGVVEIIERQREGWAYVRP